jgi:hypothetical protein
MGIKKLVGIRAVADLVTVGFEVAFPLWYRGIDRGAYIDLAQDASQCAAPVHDDDITN